MADLLTLLQRSLDELSSPSAEGIRPEVPSDAPPHTGRDPRADPQRGSSVCGSPSFRRLSIDEETIFSVIDLETTGIGRLDRIIEIAILRVRGHGEVLEEFVTLVNPDRDLGPLHIHGISTRDLNRAPSFAEIAGDILKMLEGSVMVAHNVSFDQRFIRYEMGRIGIELPDFPYLCTMQMVMEVEPNIMSRRLPDVCRHWGIETSREHSAQHDGWAALEVLRRCVDCLGEEGLPVPRRAPLQVDHEDWPSRPRGRRTLTRSKATQIQESQSSYLARLVEKLPPVKIPDQALLEYLAVVDRALEDRRVNDDEAEELFLLAFELGMTRQQTELAHKIYLRDLISVALADGILSEVEQKDLEDVRRLLGINRADYGELFSQVENKGSSVRMAIPASTELADMIGKSICFSGTLQCKINGERSTKAMAQKVASDRGLDVRTDVTRQLDFLVLSDPDSRSGKAKTARRYGLRILAEPVFWRLMGVDYQ